MKKIAVIVLLIILGYLQLAYSVHSRILKFNARRNFREYVSVSLPRSVIDTFILEDIIDKVEWHEDGKEFSLYGKMYDVTRKVKQGQQTILYCINDEKEDAIIEQELHITKNNTGKPGKNAKSLKFAFPDIILQTNQIDKFLIAQVVEKWPIQQQQELSIGTEPISPPPQS